MNIEVAKAAKREIDAAASHYWHVDRKVARRFREEILRALARIAEAPERWPVHLYGTRRVLLHRFPYSLVYRVLSDRVVIIAASHQHQRPGYWRER